MGENRGAMGDSSDDNDDYGRGGIVRDSGDYMNRKSREGRLC